MELYEAIIYIIGTGLMGVLAGTILGVILGAEQILRLRDENEKLKKEIGAMQEVARPKLQYEKPQIIEINVPIEGQNIPTFGD